VRVRTDRGGRTRQGGFSYRSVRSTDLRDGPRDLLALACTLGLIGSPARAVPPAKPARAADSAPNAGTSNAQDEAGAAFAAALAAEATRPLPRLPPAELATPSARMRAFGVLYFADHEDPKGQLRALRHFRLLRLWDDNHVSVFVGVNHGGLPGLHIQRRDPEDLPPSAPGTISSDLLRQLLPRAP
jgi:hypothetical protein